MAEPLEPSESSNRSNPSNPSKPAGDDDRVAAVRDDGLRRLLTWTFVALVITLLLAAIGVGLVTYWFDPGVNR